MDVLKINVWGLKSNLRFT